LNAKTPHRRLDLSKATTLPLSSRPSKVREALLADPQQYDAAARGIERMIPPILAGEDIRHVADAWASAVRRGRSVVLGMGAHAIKVGLSRLIVDLIERNCLQCIAATGAVAVHDLEMAMHGQTSEDVADGLRTGMFGMADETGEAYWQAVALAARESYGFGQALGRYISESSLPHRHLSILAAAYARAAPATVHVALGADVTHMRGTADGAALGAAAFRDFQVLSDVVGGLDDGGLYINLGSAVVLPEVFLKAVNIARNIGGRPHRIVTADFDMVRHYRPGQNVVARPTMTDGTGYRITGHHEILFPLLYTMVRSRLDA
jgi:hypothetical protein